MDLVWVFVGWNNSSGLGIEVLVEKGVSSDSGIDVRGGIVGETCSAGLVFLNDVQRERWQPFALDCPLKGLP